MGRKGIAGLGVLALVMTACSSSSPARPTAKAGQIVTVVRAVKGGAGLYYPVHGYALLAIDPHGTLFVSSDVRLPYVGRLPRNRGSKTVVDCRTPFPSRPGARLPESHSCNDVATLDSIGGIAVDRAGTLFISDQGHYRMLAVTARGGRREVAGHPATEPAASGVVQGRARGARLQATGPLAADGAGNLYFANGGTTGVKMGRDGMLTTVAGTGQDGYSGDGGPATAAQLERVSALAVDGRGNLYLAGGSRVRRVDPSGVITTVAGTGKVGYSGDGGPATAADLSVHIGGLTVDDAGDLFVADTYNNRVREVSPAGIVTTLAGTGQNGFSGDGGPPVQARLDYPAGLALDSAGNLFIADIYRVWVVGAVGRR